MSDAIVTTGLTKSYDGHEVVRQLSLKIPYGCVYGFLGRNGAGKSTTIKMLLGMVQPDYGTIELLGQPLAAYDGPARQRIAYLAEGHPLYRWMTVGEAVRFTRPFYPHWNQRLVEQILDHFALSNKARIRRLSNGQRAQVSLALAVAPDPDLLILDDPTLGLDTVVRRDFLESLISIIQRRGRTIFFSSHILGDVERVSDRIGIIVDGVLRVDCPTDYFKQQVRKVVARFPTGNGSVEMTILNSPVLADLPGLVGSGVVGSRLELVIVGYGSAQQAALESLNPMALEVVELNLEDAFIEYTRGNRKPLPFFYEEEADAPGISH